MNSIIFVIGDYWSYVVTATFKNSEGIPIVPTGWSIESVLMNERGQVIDTFATDWINITTGTFSHVASVAKTSKWKEGKYTFNIKFISPEGNPITSAPTQVIVTLGNKL